MSAGRKSTGKYDIEKMIKLIDEYIDTTDLPILKEVCFNNAWDYQYVMNLQAQNEQLRESIKRLLDKKEIELEKGTHAGQLDRTMAIFTLKQPVHGWTDNPEKAMTSETSASYNGLPAHTIGSAFVDAHRDIQQRNHRFYDFEGGRGSLKSSFCALEIIDLIMQNPKMCAIAMREVAETMRESIYAQIVWAISELGLESEFTCTVTPMKIVKNDTGQVIYFRGGNDPMKIKSIKPPKGMYIGVAWFEEKDQFRGSEAIRNILQSIMRGGDDIIVLGSYNTPRSQHHFINIEKREENKNRLIHKSSYLTAPIEWLGKPFFDEAERLKTINERAYRHEYLGEAVGLGLNVFDNVVEKEITDDEIRQFDRIYYGVDFGWYPDPWVFVACYFNAAQRRLFIFDEAYEFKKTNKETYDIITSKGITSRDLIICDSAENKSVADYAAFGLYAKGAEKGPGSVNYSIKWLQGLTEIVIDPRRCPNSAKEFCLYEYERTKDGEVISSYPDKNNHCIDAVRYALNYLWRQRGM